MVVTLACWSPCSMRISLDPFLCHSFCSRVDPLTQAGPPGICSNISRHTESASQIHFNSEQPGPKIQDPPLDSALQPHSQHQHNFPAPFQEEFSRPHAIVVNGNGEFNALSSPSCSVRRAEKSRS